jgi:glycosyltransferase involved in cell wall biosynthesis
MIGDRERWGQAGLKRAKAFSWRKAARQTIAVYESLLSRR